MKRVFKNLIIFMAASMLAMPLSAQKAGKKNSNNNGNGNSGKIPPLIIQTADQTAFNLDGNKVGMSVVLSHLLQYNEQISQLLYDAVKADSEYEKFQQKYGFYLQANGSYTSSDYADDAITNASGSSNKNTKTSVALAKGFSTGTTFSVGMQNNYNHTQDMDAAYGDYKYFQPVLFVSVQQELLKNMFGYQERRQNKMLRNQETIINEMVLYQASAISVDAIVSAWQLALANSTLSNAKLRLYETQKVRRIIRKNVQIGLNESYDLNYWNAQVAGDSAQVVNASNDLHHKELDVKLKFNLKDNSVRESSIAILANTLPDIDTEEALKIAYARRADYIQAKLALDNAKMSLAIYKNDALPSVKAGVTVSSVGQRDAYSDALNDSLNGSAPTYEFTLSMTYPIYGKLQRTNERDAQIAVKQAELELSRIKKQVTNDVLNSINSIKAAYESYTKARTARIQSEIYYTRLRRQLRRGRFSASVIKQALDGMINSRQQELGALVNYNATLLQFDIVQNHFFSKYSIDIKTLIAKKREQN